MKIRNAKYTSDTTIDVEIEHPKHGWIPYTFDTIAEVIDDIQKEVAKYIKTASINAFEPTAITREAELAKINNEYENAIRQLATDVPDSEKNTWLKQEQEARAWIVDNKMPTPFIDSLISERADTLLTKGLTEEQMKPYMISKIIEKANAYAQAIGMLTGERQRLVDLLESNYINQIKGEKDGI